MSETIHEWSYSLERPFLSKTIPGWEHEWGHSWVRPWMRPFMCVKMIEIILEWEHEWDHTWDHFCVRTLRYHLWDRNLSWVSETIPGWNHSSVRPFMHETIPVWNHSCMKPFLYNGIHEIPFWVRPFQGNNDWLAELSWRQFLYKNHCRKHSR